MKKYLLFLFLIVSGGVNAGAGEWKPTEKMLQAVRQIESNGGLNTYGDGGSSLGDFQMGKAAWSDVNDWRKARGLKIYAYQNHVLKPQINRIYASNYFSLIHSRLRKQYRREPTTGELYAAYNLGITKFQVECNYDFKRINKVTAQKSHQIKSMME